MWIEQAAPDITIDVIHEHCLRELCSGLRDMGLLHGSVEELIETALLPHLMRYDQAGFQSMYNSIPEPGAALGARVALAHNQGVTNWQVSPGAVMLEEMCGR